MECDKCGEILDDYNFYCLEECRTKKIKAKFCSPKCTEEYIESENIDSSEFLPIKVYHCPAAIVCDKLNNLRGICERREVLEEYGRGRFALPISWCESGIAGILLSNEKLEKSIEKLNISINEFNKTSTRLTYLIILLAILTAIISGVSLF